MITLIYTYRNRDLQRVQNSLDSLAIQNCNNFKVVFVDYGSDSSFANPLKDLIQKYDFVEHHYLFTSQQIWNKSKAINYALQRIDSEYCFIADIDIIFHPDFTKVLDIKRNPNIATYFQVGFLAQNESVEMRVNYNDYKIDFLSTKEVTGMTLFPVVRLKQLRGFDEFFHCWGAEDTDIHNRLQKSGCKIKYYDSQILLLHQWHLNYRKQETDTLKKELQLNGIVELNYQHLMYNLEKGITVVNVEQWGNALSQLDYEMLTNLETVAMSNEASVIEHFLFVGLPSLQNQIISVRIEQDALEFSWKYKIKRILGKKVPKYLSLKEINDKLLLHIISFYHQMPYIYTISNDLKSISFKILKQDTTKT